MQYFFCCVINCSCEIIAISCTVPFAISCTVAFAISCTVTFTVVHLVLNLRFPLSLLHCHAPLFHWRTPPLSPSYTFAFTTLSYTFAFTTVHHPKLSLTLSCTIIHFCFHRIIVHFWLFHRTIVHFCFHRTISLLYTFAWSQQPTITCNAIAHDGLCTIACNHPQANSHPQAWQPPSKL